MIGSEAALRLLIGLVGAVFALIGFADRRDTRNRRGALNPRALLYTVVAALPLFVWALWPEVFEVASVQIPLSIRRFSLVAGAAAILTRYQSARARNRENHGENDWRVSPGWHYASLGLLFVAMAVGTANWLVTSAVAVALVLTAATLAVASRRESSSQHSNQQDSR